MKVGDLVTFKIEKEKLDVPRAIGIVMKTEKTSSVTYNVWVSWNFMNGLVGRNFSFELAVLDESR